MPEDRTLLHAIAAPRSRHAQHVHLSCEAGQQLPLRVSQLDAVVKIQPALLLVSGTVTSEEIIVSKPAGKPRREIQHYDFFLLDFLTVFFFAGAAFFFADFLAEASPKAFAQLSEYLLVAPERRIVTC